MRICDVLSVDSNNAPQPQCGMTKVLHNLGSRVRAERESLGLSQEEFAEKCGFDRTYISLIERGKRNIALLNLEKVAKGLGTTVSILTEGIDSGTNT